MGYSKFQGCTLIVLVARLADLNTQCSETPTINQLMFGQCAQLLCPRKGQTQVSWRTKGVELRTYLRDKVMIPLRIGATAGLVHFLSKPAPPIRLYFCSLPPLRADVIPAGRIGGPL